MPLWMGRTLSLTTSTGRNGHPPHNDSKHTARLAVSRSQEDPAEHLLIRKEMDLVIGQAASLWGQNGCLDTCSSFGLYHGR